MTYRAVGSSTGIKEFSEPNPLLRNDFGSGDIPISRTIYESLNAEITTANETAVAHFPIVMGAVSFFNSIPGMKNNENPLNLTSCQLAKIFKREIIYWDNAEIKADNPNLNLPHESYPIKVAHRVKGSSSTSAISKYLYETCPGEWPLSMVGSTVNWEKDTMSCEGSAGMTSCIRDVEGAIGYIDAGHGHDEGLIEVAVKNKDGNYLTSLQAGPNGIGQAALQALDLGILPSSSFDDYSEVHLLNMPGSNTWPIVGMSYVYVRMNVKEEHHNPQKEALLKFFVESLYDRDVIAQCSVFGFVPVPSRVRDIALAGLQKLNVGNGPTFKREVDTMPNGQAPYVVSKKRRNFYEVQSGDIASDLEDTYLQLKDLYEEVGISETGYVQLSVEDKAMLEAAFGLGVCSLILWGLTFAFFLMRKCGMM